MIGRRPRARSTTNAMIRACSSKSTVADSPVVPTATMASVPLSACHSTREARASQSTSPPTCMGVTRATALPRIIERSFLLLALHRVAIHAAEALLGGRIIRRFADDLRHLGDHLLHHEFHDFRVLLHVFREV